MHKLMELKEMLMRELEELTKKGELSAGSLDAVDKLTHSIKSICYIIEEMENEEGYSEARGGGRGRGRNARRDSMGRYSEGGSYREGGSSYRDGGSYREGGSSYRDGGSYYREGGRGGRSGRNYSREDAKEEIVEQLREMEMDAKDEETRRMVQKWIKQAEQD